MVAFVLLATALAGCGRGNSSHHVELVTGSSPPTPATTFELRFESIMVKGDRVGMSATNSPLIISPPLAGTFTWLSSRSGVFTPTEPLALDTTYQLSLQPGLNRADGSPSDATLHWSVSTPSFGVSTASPQWMDDRNASSMPEIKVAFNADVRAADAAQFISFRDDKGRRIPADVWQGTVEESGYIYNSDALRTWKQNAAALDRGNTERNDPATPPNGTNEVPNLLVVAPHRPLPIGNGWKLVVGRGIPAADGSMRSSESTEVRIGDVTPFAVLKAEAKHFINFVPQIHLTFSKAIPESLTNGYRDVLELSPNPTNLTVGVGGQLLVLRGDFQSGTTYTLKLRPGFQALEPFTLQGSNTFKLLMPHVPPRLYFPSFACDQLANGNRVFPLTTINVSRVRVRAKLMDPHTAIHALRGYASYFASMDERQESFDWTERYRQIDYNLVAGTTVFDKELDPGRESETSDATKELNLAWDELLGGRRTGVVFLDARRTRTDDDERTLGTQALIQLTDLGVVWKTSPASVNVFVFSHRTGQPVTNAVVRLFSKENAPLREGVTDLHGLARLDASPNASWVAVQHDDDFHAVKLGERQAWTYRSDFLFARFSEPEDPRRVMMFSDRDLYRPGETMNLETIVRDWANGALNVPSGLTGVLQCVDAREKKFFQTNVTLSSLGSWSIPVPLPMAPCGRYSATLRFASHDYSYSFQVAEFQPNAFEILLPSRDAYAPDELIQLPLSARYLFGKTLSRAQVSWSLTAMDTDFRPEKFHSFNFRRDDFELRYGRGRSSISLNGRGALNGGSNFVIAPNISPNPTAPQPRYVSLLAEVTDVNQQTLSRHVGFVRHSSDFYLGLRQPTELLNESSPPKLEVVALRSDGKPWPENVSAHLTLQRIDWQSVRVQGAGRTIRFRNEAVFTNILERDVVVRPVALPQSSDDEAKGNLIEEMPLLSAGEYLMEVKTKDAGGRTVASSMDFRVTAAGEVGWNYRNDVDLALKPDRKSYAPGETAEILVQAPFSGTALVSVEREKVLRSFVTRLEGNAPLIRVPIEAGDVPNVSISVTLTRGSDESPHKIKEPEYRVGNCGLTVSNPESRLRVDVTPANSECLPGKPVEVVVQINDAMQRPVPGAEVVLYAVDDGILGLTDYALPDPHAFFFAPRALGVLSAISLPNLLSEDPEELTFANKGFLVGGGGEDRVRKNFLACAFWNATLRSDTNGQVHARFTAPDSLTRYRVLAVAHTADSRFGSGQSAVHVSKPLMIEPSLPLFGNIADRLIARGVILNQTTNAADVIVTLELDDKAKAIGTGPILNRRQADFADREPSRLAAGENAEAPSSIRVPVSLPAAADGDRPRSVVSRRISIPPKGSVAVEFPVEFIDTGESKWLWRARFADAAAGGFADAVQSTTSVGHIAPTASEALLSHVTTGRSNLLALANPQLLAGRGTITVQIANTRLNELSETVSQLLHYPYGCAEQTGSSLLPWILLRDNPALLSNCAAARTKESASAIRAGVTRLFSMQTSSGGLGYWPHAKEPMFWASAYGGMVLAIAQRHGVAVPKEEFESLLKYLSQQLRSSSNDADLSDCCLALYALSLAGRAEPAYHEKLYSRRGSLSAEDRALLALAITGSRGSAEMIGELLAAKSPSHGDDAYRFNCTAREQAVQLLAWIAYQPDNSIIDRLVSDLMREQKRAHWGTTQGDAWALLALTEYARRVETRIEHAEGELNYAGQTILFQLDANTNVFTHTFSITNIANAALFVSKASTNRLYTSVSIEARLPELPQPRQDRGFGLQRRYDRLDDDNQPQGSDGWRVGDRILVTLRLDVREPANYVVIDDALPSILEAVNPEFRTQQARGTQSADEGGTWWPSDFRELRKDRCLSFANWVGPGTYTLGYLARVRAAGSVTAPPAKVEEMYHPERCGFTETQPLVSEMWK